MRSISGSEALEIFDSSKIITTLSDFVGAPNFRLGELRAFQLRRSDSMERCPLCQRAIFFPPVQTKPRKAVPSTTHPVRKCERGPRYKRVAGAPDVNNSVTVG